MKGGDMKDVLPNDEEAAITALPMSISSSDSSTTVTSHRRRRLARRFTALPLVSRSIRLIRFILGPSTRLADSDIPQPQPSFSLNFTLPTKSWHLPVDERLRSLSSRFHLSWALVPFLALWAMGFVLLIRQQYYVAAPQIITCDSALWGTWPPDTCGVNGTGCLDALYEGTYRCMGGCQDVPLGNPRWIGGDEVNGVPLVIGGNDSIYRADSWICPSAIHAGLISATLGGCITVHPLPFIWGHSNFTASKSHGIQSVGFEPKFPGAYQLRSTGEPGCLDLHPIISFFNSMCLLITVLFLQPRPGILFSILVVLGWFQITLVSDTAYVYPNWEWVFGGVPAALLASYWAWRVAFKRTLKAFVNLPLDVGIWQGAGFWIGMESSIIFSRLPIQRLGYGKLSADGIISLVVIVIAIFIVVVIQAWQMRKYGMLQYYLFRYLPLAPILIILSVIPGYTLRIHHYLYTLAAMPVLSLPNRISLFGQAFVYGLFLDGIGRWGWASILQQTTSLIGDAIHGTFVPYPLANSTSSLIEWASIPTELVSLGFTSVSIIVDDILRDVSNGTTYPIGQLNLTAGIDHFFRLAYVANGTSLDYINPVQISPNGTLTLL